MQLIPYPEPSRWKELLQRPTASAMSLEAIVDEVFTAVRESGDPAVRQFTERFDGVSPESLVLPKEEADRLAAEVPADLKAAIDLAYDNIRKFHEAQRTGVVRVETRPGVTCWQEKKPIEKVGIYIPGGTAPLFSTVLMLAIPAALAGCREIVLCSPPDAQGALHPAICYAAGICGVHTICRVGGIQAIAAMTYGTREIPSVYKIFGPGNQYVTQAKQRAVKEGVAIDMPAGPSEVLVVADSSAKPAYVASDLLSQAEHGRDSQVLLLTDDAELPGAVREELRKQLRELPRREIAADALGNSKIVLLGSVRELADMINAYAPEHLIVCHREEAFLLAEIRNAGSVFLGNYTPESAGDYASGTNHTLPTNGFARQYSGVNLDSYTKSITYQRLSSTGIREIGPAIATMATAEGLHAHARAVSIRLEDLKAKKGNKNGGDD
ncbi:histidinol dehydrogenase [Robiginitalea sp. SC105]|uniref:histidinol dehydrogenase n=1 Tax=Robiginitalea sp. SC105 TaxID=2762332 RepID=UPI00163B12B6|nr:histidinol dehydrogenase [Robiginitalea sp. SC105]MBC2840602.1 histidinol dehydrogenase [Robiginitalea sp. SC105]